MFFKSAISFTGWFIPILHILFLFTVYLFLFLDQGLPSQNVQVCGFSDIYLLKRERTLHKYFYQSLFSYLFLNIL